MSKIQIKVPADSEEGTTMKVQTWLRQPGDKVVENEPLVEMETDKVTMEIESPCDGVLMEIIAQPDAEVTPNMVIGYINTKSHESKGDDGQNELDENAVVAEKTSQNDKVINTTLSPAVRRYVAEHNIDVSKIVGTGKNKRITLKDVKAFDSSSSKNSAMSEFQLSQDKVVQEKVAQDKAAKPTAKVAIEGDSQHIPHSSMRRSIADHMLSSVTQAPHVTAVFDADFSAIMAHRAANAEAFKSKGVNLTFTAYFLSACAQAMNAVPEVNSQWHADSVEIFSNINIGVGVALGDKGLVVPVIKHVQEKNLFEIAQELQTVTERAKNNELTPNDVRGGTFTISNHGVSGSLLATPIIINQPQSAILGVGKLEKRVVVKEVEGQDVMLIKPMAFVSLSIDHRVIDGYQTNSWLSHFVAALEQWPAD